jgi:signal transduction histidine kinase
VKDHARATHVYRITQEAINNAVRHGKARHIDIVLTQNGATITLSVLSDGAASPALQEKRGDGMGLYTMKYRADMIGGTVEIRPAEPSGTEVICTFPKE